MILHYQLLPPQLANLPLVLLCYYQKPLAILYIFSVWLIGHCRIKISVLKQCDINLAFGHVCLLLSISSSKKRLKQLSVRSCFYFLLLKSPIVERCKDVNYVTACTVLQLLFNAVY